MPEGLTQTKTPTSKNPAGFKSECRPVSFRNRGRLQIGTVAGFKSEYPAGINRNPHAWTNSCAMAGGTIVMIDYRPLPSPGNEVLKSFSRVIVKIGTEYWAIERGKTLAEKHRLTPTQLPAELSKL